MIYKNWLLITLFAVVCYAQLNGMEQGKALVVSSIDFKNALYTFQGQLKLAMNNKDKFNGIVAVDVLNDIQEELLDTAFEADNSEAAIALLKESHVRLSSLDQTVDCFRKTSQPTREFICQTIVKLSDTPTGKKNLMSLAMILSKLNDEKSLNYLRGIIG